VLDEIVQIQLNTEAARRLLTRLLAKQGCRPKRIITDKLGSYAAAKREVMPNVEHRQHKGLNNRAENSHVPLRKRERCKDFDDGWDCSISFRPSPLFATISFRPVHTALRPYRPSSSLERNGGVESRRNCRLKSPRLA
jgi:hypothetical protein